MDLKEALVTVVKPEYVIDDAKLVEAYSRDYSLSMPRMPNFVVKPNSYEWLAQSHQERVGRVENWCGGP